MFSPLGYDEHECARISQDPALILLEYIPRSGIAGLDPNCIFNLQERRGLQTVFSNNCTILHSHPQGTIIPSAQHPYQRILFFLLLIVTPDRLPAF